MVGQTVPAAALVAATGSATARLRVPAPDPMAHSVDLAPEVAAHAAARRAGLPALEGLEVVAGAEASVVAAAGEDAVE